MTVNEMNAIQIFDSAEGYAPITNLIAIGDPDVHKFGNQWWMFLGGAYTANAVNLYSASLPPGETLSSTRWEITTDPSDPHTAVPLVEQPEAGRWDEWLHTPSYARGLDPNSPDNPTLRERIYYTGSSGATHDDRNFSIGVMEKTESGWTRREDPVSAAKTRS